MLIIVIVLMVLAFIATLAGGALAIMRGGGLKRREVSDEEAASILSGSDEDEDEGSVTLFEAERTAFRGKAVGASGEVSISLAELAAKVRSGSIGEAAPWLLLAGGLLALVVLVAPLLWLTVSPWAGAGWLAVLLVTLVQGYRNSRRQG